MSARFYLIISTILLQTLVIGIILVVILITDDIQSLKTYLPFATIIILFLSGLVVASIRQIDQYNRREIEGNLLKEHLRQIEDMFHSLSILRHEHTRHLQTLQAMLYLGEIEEARGYLDGLAESCWEVNEFVYIGHPALSALVNAKKKLAELKNVHFAVAVKADVNALDIPPWDLCSIMGNLLDNALEAAVKDEKQKRVSLEIKVENHNIIFYLYNSGAKIPPTRQSQIYEPGYTTSGSEARGFGLYLVKKLVDKHRGTITLVSEPRTTFIVSLPQRSDAKSGQKDVAISGRSHGQEPA